MKFRLPIPGIRFRTPGRLLRILRILTGRGAAAPTRPSPEEVAETVEGVPPADECTTPAPPGEPDVTAQRPRRSRKPVVATPRREYEAIGRVGVLQPTAVPGSPAMAIPGGAASVATAGSPPPAPVPAAVLEMNRDGAIPPTQRPAEFRVSQYPGPEADLSIDLTDDLYGYVARTINLKLRISAAKQEG